MARTTPELVAGVIEVDDDVDLTPFIAAANELVTEKCLDSDYSSTRLEMIETWLAAHFYAIRDRQMSQVNVSTLGSQYEGKVDLGLDVTVYGQQAKRLDTDGNLAELDNSMQTAGEPVNVKKKVGMTWLGTDLKDQYS